MGLCPQISKPSSHFIPLMMLYLHFIFSTREEKKHICSLRMGLQSHLHFWCWLQVKNSSSAVIQHQYLASTQDVIGMHRQDKQTYKQLVKMWTNNQLHCESDTTQGSFSNLWMAGSSTCWNTRAIIRKHAASAVHIEKCQALGRQSNLLHWKLYLYLSSNFHQPWKCITSH